MPVSFKGFHFFIGITTYLDILICYHVSITSISTLRSERCLKKNCLENRFSTTKQIKLNLKSRGILASEKAIWHNLSKMNFKAHRHALEAQINSCYGCKKSGMGKGSRFGLLEIGKYYFINSTPLL